MCGIAGYKSFQAIDPQVLKNMIEALYHRGPDAEGYYHTNGFHAGMRRLSINDLQTGDQPLYNSDKTVILLYNGEIYNSPQLRQELKEKGYVFTTHSDGEVICHLYDQYREGLFEKLDGMFAVALWIETEQKLILARDLPGEKPLYYSAVTEKEIVFASEIKSLVKFPGLALSLNIQALWDFPTFLWIPEPDTVYDKINAIPRGHYLIADSTGISLHPYANRFHSSFLAHDTDEIICETRRVVTEAITTRLLSDVTVGSFLSGGLDSSIVTSVAAQNLPNLHAFTIGFEKISDPYHGMADESANATEFAEHLGIPHHCIFITADDFRRNLIKFCLHGDQPFSVSSGLGILSVAEAAHERGVKVLLSGDGADECFGGYSWYFYLDDQKDFGLSGPAPLADTDISFQNFGMTIEERLNALRSYPPPKRAWAWHYYASEAEKTTLYNRDYFATARSSLHHFDKFKSSPQWTPEDFIKQDREFYFPFEMLRKVDRMTMAFSVEGRVPFAAPSVLAHADKLRYRHQVRGNDLKWVLRQAFAEQLPAHIYNRPKHGFNVPIDHWLKGEWADLLEATFSPSSRITQLGILRKDCRKDALRMLHDPLRLNGHTLFSYIMLNLWLENAYGNHR